MVLTLIMTVCVCGSPSHSTILLSSVVSARVHLGREVVPFACMALLQHLQAAGFSEEVSRLAAAPRRSSISRIYDSRWLRFAHWATEQGF